MPHDQHDQWQEHIQLRPSASMGTRSQKQPLPQELTQVGQHRSQLSLLNIRKYFKSCYGTSKIPYFYMLQKDIVPLVQRNEAIRYWSDPDKMLIKRCFITSIEQHGVYVKVVNAKVPEGLHDVRSPKSVLELAMCYTKLKIIVEKTPADTCINKFYKTHDVCTTYRKLQYTFLGQGFTQCCTRQLEEELCSLKH